ncbi:GNAT family N-acetyltransferase [Arachnia propionica]|uniref:GNAT family N-acetyltransferase n=1 Tax=Arachnia propionica TaxID=1750 RepID=UPI003C6F5BB6
MQSDCPAILEVMFSTPMSRESSWWLNTVESLEAKLASGGGFVAEADGRIVGCVMHVVSDTDLVMRGLAVRPEFENRGIGTALVEAIEAGARARDLPRVLLAVSASNLEVCDYYLRLGYVVSEEPYAHAAPGRPAPAVFTKEL